ncbi:hypothetical protein ACSAZL_10245 [Methanosarcina sp. T3]|uniref:hypothetical protein n=1 Tax=Methanosarcina sp. T3 TaxID=3439062 RepID=UPI003F8470C4
MKQQLEQRLQELRAEFESGQKMLADLESKQANLRDTMLRISGAIQVLEELSTTADSIGESQGEAGQTTEKPDDQKTEMEMVTVE